MDVETFVWCRLLVVVVGMNGEGAALYDGIFWSERYFLRDPLSVWGAGEGGVGLGDVYGKLLVHLRVGCCIARPRYYYSGPAEGGGFSSLLLIARGIGPGIRPIMAVAAPGINILAGDGS